MSKGYIIDEIRKNRELFASRFDYDLEKIFNYLKGLEKTDKHEKASFPPKPVSSPIRNTNKRK
jgi:hypothetical protein